MLIEREDSIRPHEQSTTDSHGDHTEWRPDIQLIGWLVHHPPVLGPAFSLMGKSPV